MPSFNGTVITLPAPYPPIPANATDSDIYCTLALCPLSLAHFTYLPTLVGNALFAALFGILILSQFGLGIRYRTWGFLVGMTFGLTLEIIGYVARIQMHSNPFQKSPFLMYLITLTIGPAFLSGSIYLCLARIVVAYSQHVSPIKPRTYTVIFMTCDFIALLLQAAGGAMASSATTQTADQTGINIMIAGVSWQVVSLAIFAALCIFYARKVRSVHVTDLNPAFDTIRDTKRFRGFIYALGVATTTILIRSVFRCAELSQGFHGRLANQQITFMILEGPMIIIAVLALTVFHPGLAFQGHWGDATWSLRGKEADRTAAKKSSLRWGFMSRRSGNQITHPSTETVEKA